jgi:hypothetical protein
VKGLQFAYPSRAPIEVVIDSVARASLPNFVVPVAWLSYDDQPMRASALVILLARVVNDTIPVDGELISAIVRPPRGPLSGFGIRFARDSRCTLMRKYVFAEE